MRFYLFLILIFVNWTTIKAQYIERATINPCGINTENKKNINFSVGQFSYSGSEIIPGILIFNNSKKIQKNVQKLPKAKINIKIYPIPAQNFLNIIITCPDKINNLNLIIHSNNGQYIKNIKIRQSQETYYTQRIKIEDLNPGTYFLSVYAKNKLIKTFLFLKQ